MSTTVDIRIDSLAFGGDGIGRHEGLVVFVPETAPGDLMRVRITARNRSYLRAQALKVLEEGSGRVQPPCPVYSACGGCQWQHVDYASQFAAKVQIVRRALLPDNNTVSAMPSLHEHPAPAQYGYRRRARLAFANDKSLHAGLLARQSNRIVDTESCPQLMPALQTAFLSFRSLLAGLPKSRGEIELLANHNGEVHAAIRLRTGVPHDIQDTVARYQGNFAGVLVTNQNHSRFFGNASIKLDDRGIDASAGCFTQANGPQDAVLRRIVRERLKQISAANVMEFHAGIGNFTFDLADAGIVVSAVESNPLAADFLRRNVSGLGVETVCADAERYTWTGNPDCILLDPPREGAPELCRHIAATKARQVIYVSCDPMTLARDVRVLQGGAFRLEHVHVIDMMPQTYHMEAACFLSRK